MIPGSKGHAIHACMNWHDFGTRKNMRMQPDPGVIRMVLELRELSSTELTQQFVVSLYFY